MIKSLPEYPAYKPSGVEWLGKVPEHWRVMLNQRIFKEQIRPHRGLPETQLSLSQRDGLIATSAMQERSLQTSTYDNWKVTLPGDLVVNRFKAHLGVFFASTLRGIVSFHYGVFSPRRVLATRYFELLYHTNVYRTIYAGQSNGMTVGLQNLSNQSFYNVRSPVPPLDEQVAIVRFLDHVDRRIRRYIRAKQRLIALLEEQKQAVIHRAVTRGLDPNVRLKPSGVEWLGDVPEHWEVRRLKSILWPVDRRSSTGTETLLSLRRDHGVVVYAEHFSRPPQGATMIGFKLVDVGHLVVNRLQANNGLVFCSGLTGLVSPDYSVFEARSPVNMQYLSSILRTVPYRTHFRRVSTGLGTGTSGFLRLYDDKLLETIAVLPPLEEQDRLLDRLSEDTSTIARVVERQQMELRLLNEYRTRLIADVVTGKLDVREAAARLPEEGEEPEVLDMGDDLTDPEAGAADDLDDTTEDDKA